MNFLLKLFGIKRTTNNQNLEGPIFVGSEDDFNKYIGPYTRNLVQKITKTHKNRTGCCEHCECENIQLDAAHIRGKERKEIIKSIIYKYNRNGRLEVDMYEFEQIFIEEHNPIENVIMILCKDCHYKYDSVTNDSSIIPVSNRNEPKYVTVHPETENINQTVMTKDSAINIINNKLNLNLNTKNTNWSNINANDIWSIEPSKERKKHDLFLILNNNRTKKLHVFKIQANHKIYEELYYRSDKQTFRLLFDLNDEVFIETLKYINFKNYHVDTVDYSDIFN